MKQAFPYFIIASYLLMVACTANDIVDDSGSHRQTDNSVVFDTYVEQSKTTRATYGYQGALTTEKLRNSGEGFAVFAVHTDETDYDYDYASSSGSAFNFMFNQQVTAFGENEWTYSPVKYWPNDYSTDDVGGGATGSKNGGKVSFFGYAPYVTDKNDVGDTNDGIVDITANTESSKDSYVTYRINTTSGEPPLVTPSTSDYVDLLWAVPQYDLYKKTGGDKVHMVFKHALSKLNIVVQGLFDSHTDIPAFDGYSDDVDSDTRVLIEEVEIRDAQFPTKAKMYLVPSTLTPTMPRWEIADNKISTGFTISDTHANFNKALKSTGNKPTTSAASAEAAKEDFDALPIGVTKAEQSLFDDADRYYIFPPVTTPMTVRLKYHVITYDEHLDLNIPKYFSIVTNNITATFDSNITFEAGKLYTLRLMPGLTSVKFEVVDVTNWEVPIVLGAVVKEWQIVTHEYDIE